MRWNTSLHSCSTILCINRIQSPCPNRAGGNGHKWNGKFPLNIRKHFSYCESDRTLAQVAQWGGGVSSFVQKHYPQKPPGDSVGHSRCPTWAEGVEHDNLQRPNQSQSIKDSVIHGGAESNRITIFSQLFPFLGGCCLMRGRHWVLVQIFFFHMHDRKDTSSKILLAVHLNNCGPQVMPGFGIS